MSLLVENLFIISGYGGLQVLDWVNGSLLDMYNPGGRNSSLTHSSPHPDRVEVVGRLNGHVALICDHSSPPKAGCSAPGLSPWPHRRRRTARSLVLWLPGVPAGCKETMINY